MFYYELYFNDIDNLWLICNACNLQKSDSEIINWLSNQWLYGQKFLDYLGPLKDDAILKKTKNKRGLAEVAIQYTSSDDEAYVKDEKEQIIQISVEEYKRAALKTTESISMMTQQILRENITNEVNKRKKHEDKSEEEVEERASKTPKIDK